jgi:MFS family permease
VERAGDSIGAIVGPLGAAALIGVLGYRWLFAVSVLPAIGAALAVLLLVREAPRIRSAVRVASGGMWSLARSPGPFRRLVAGVGLYGLGNFSSTLLILRATDLLAHRGATPIHAATVAVLLYTAHNAANALAAYPAGAVADRIGRRVVLAAGVLMFAGACMAFAWGSADLSVLAILFVVVGASKALVETGEGSYASELLPPEIRGRGFGLLGLVDGVGDLVSSVTVGVLWTVTTPTWGFLYAAVMSLAGALVLAVRAPGARSRPALRVPGNPAP